MLDVLIQAYPAALTGVVRGGMPPALAVGIAPSSRPLAAGTGRPPM